ncbi:PAP fimbrial minor pilin protein precursor [Serratia fonticola]|jgi:type 1 fimbria pilin|nr:PAP fimbrial minor pilin protein precursor [Serratia fonticola]CAI1011621.1 PAP fimbrial minor pilin protein precursor [Serratia fonticola]CAI1613466.1 PAP fimbrial minor pilin protein precursor [Serratia fonticola]CAI1739741.1 PAP fimbrial minor pilin protein precursor [Serratia fonticola]CAI1786553.1 PAP fimbrial minor pilin protein precursor [Serratia fonticola]
MVLKGINGVNKMGYAVTGCLFSALLCATATGETLMGRGRVIMEGSIIATACAIEMNSRDQVIEMITIPLAKIAREGRGIAKPFAIRLINCTLQRVGTDLPDWQTFRVTFDGTPDGPLLGVEGDARGVGLQIKDQRGNIALPGVPLPTAELNPGDRLLHYTMNLVPNHQLLRAGEYRSTVRFKMDYY